MQFANPWMLILLVPTLGGLLWAERRYARERARGRRRMAGERVAELAPTLVEKRSRWKRRTTSLAVLLLVVALARPQFGTHFTEVKQEGIDIVFAIDTSRSMLAEDLSPNRLERARLEIEALLPRLGGDRVAIVAFAGAAFVECPLTLDHGALRLFLDALSPDLIPRPGTDLEAAIRKAIAAFPDEKNASRVVILLSDGEGFEGDAEKAGEAAAEKGIVIHAVGLGSPEGEPIPEFDEAGNRLGYKKDAQGQVVMSRLDESTLSRLALATGGRYYRVSGNGFALDEVMNEIATMARQETESRFVVAYEERFQWPLAAALLLLLLDSGILLGRAPRGWRRIVVAMVALGTLLLGLPRRSWAGDFYDKAEEGNKAYAKQEFDKALEAYKQAAVDAPERADLQYNVGTALLKTGDTEEAAHVLERAAIKAKEDPEIRRDSHYNRGEAFLAAQDYASAIDAFQAAIDEDPRDADALYNLELALRKQQEQQKQKQQEQQDQQNQQQQDQQEQQDQQDQQDQQEQQDQQDQQEQQDQQDQQDQEQQDQQDQQDQQQQEQSAQPDSTRMDEQLANQILDAIAEDEGELHKARARMMIPNSDKPEKDW